MRERVVDEGVGARDERRSACASMLSTPNWAKNRPTFTSRPRPTVREVRLGVELHRVDAVGVRLAVVGGELAVEQAAGDGEAVVDAGQDRVGAEAEGRRRGRWCPPAARTRSQCCWRRNSLAR